MNFPPADHPVIKLPVHIAHVGVGHMHNDAILLPQKPDEVATVPHTQSRQHMVLEEAVVPTAVQVGKALKKLEEHSKNHVSAAFICVFMTVWIMNGYNLNG